MDIDEIHMEIGKLIKQVSCLESVVFKMSDKIEGVQEKIAMGKGIIWFLGLGSSLSLMHVIGIVWTYLKNM